jgi:hypothetical protein
MKFFSIGYVLMASLWSIKCFAQVGKDIAPVHGCLVHENKIIIATLFKIFRTRIILLEPIEFLSFK